MRISCATLAALLLLAAGSVRADEERQSDFWPSVLDPGRKEFEGAMERGMSLLEKARTVRSEPLRSRILADALAAFREATRHSPGNYRGWYQTAGLLMDMNRTRQAVAAYRRVRQLGVEESGVRYGVAFNLGIAHSKAGAFEKAVLEYDRADSAVSGATRSRDVRGSRSTLHGNAAEALMALGRLDEAIQRYRESLSYLPGNTLVRYGLAVAYDRDEQVSKAQQEMRTVLASDPNMRRLTNESVFFIPDGDIHYYFALGHHTKGNLDQAKKQWQLFLQKLPGCQWAARAQAHLAELGVAAAKQPRRRGRLAPVPKVARGQVEAGSRDRAAIRSRIRGYLYRMRSCYKSELRKQPNLSGELVLALTVQRNGRADNVRVIRSTVRRPSLHRCMVNVIKRIYFTRPLSGRPVRMEYPIKLRP